MVLFGEGGLVSEERAVRLMLAVSLAKAIK
jgi:hypothetical protein